MRLFTVTGPPASGKTTTSRMIAESFHRCALIDGDVIYDMIVSGQEQPWLSESQVNMAFKNITGITLNFLFNGFDVVLDWIVMPDQVESMVKSINMKDLKVYYIVLMASPNTLKFRDRTRDGSLLKRIEVLYREFAETAPEQHMIYCDNLDRSTVVKSVLENPDRFEMAFR
ncbi:MAG: AAA family ATPase [Thermoplasmataceae archaeon]